MDSTHLEAHVVRASEHYRMVKAFTDADLAILIEVHQNGMLNLVQVIDPGDLAAVLRMECKPKPGGRLPTCLIFNADMAITEADWKSGLPLSVSQGLLTIGVAPGLDPIFRAQTYWDTGNGLAFETFTPDKVLDPEIVTTLQSVWSDFQ